MNGFEFLEQFANLREDHPERYSPTKVMMFTSSELEADQAKATEHDFVIEYLVKPVTPKHVDLLLEKHYKP